MDTQEKLRDILEKHVGKENVNMKVINEINSLLEVKKLEFFQDETHKLWDWTHSPERLSATCAFVKGIQQDLARDIEYLQYKVKRQHA